MHRRWATIALAVVGILWIPTTAFAHANMAGSDPAGGSGLEQAPERVVITFTEPPDPSLTSVKITGQSGSYATGDPELVPGDDRSVAVDVEGLENGSYTVSWRTVSKVDGHTSAGGFAFGVGEAPDPSATVSVDDKSAADPAGSATRWVLYLGLVAMLGASWIAAMAVPEPPSALFTMFRRSWWLSVAGLAGLGVSQWLDSGTALSAYLGSSAVGALVQRGIPLLATGGAWIVLRNQHRSRWLAVAAGTAATMLAHVMAGHAAVAPSQSLKIAAQWVHFGAIGVWLGGLAALLVALRSLPDESKLGAARRFSMAATVSIVLVIGTGILRSVNELGELSALTQTDYGLLILGKSGLIVALGVLGGINRFRNVARVNTNPLSLMKIGRMEVVIAIVALGLAGTLANSVPPVSDAAAARQQGPIEVEATNFARTAQVKLTVAPGTPGINRFTLELRSSGSADPLEAESVTLRFQALTDPSAQPSTLDMKRLQTGTYEASGPNVSAPGRYLTTALITTESSSFEIPIEFSTKRSFTVTTSQAEGQPTIYMVTDEAGRQLHFYTDPQEPGESEVHFTFFSAAGQELPVADVIVLASYEEALSNSLVTRRFGPGHFVADMDLKEGLYLFDTVAITEDQQRHRFATEVTIP